MPIELRCECGKRLRVRDELLGKRGKCPVCGKILVIRPTVQPVEQETGEIPLADEPAPPVARRAPVAVAAARPAVVRQPAVARPAPRSAARAAPASPLESQPVGAPALAGVREYLYCALLLALLPLAWSTFLAHDDIKSRIEHTISANRAQLKGLGEDASMDEFLAALPGDRIEGAHLPRQTTVHWAYAAISAIAFFSLIASLFPGRLSRPKYLVGAGMFTATVGIVLLIVLQFLAEWSQGFWLRGRSIIVVIFYVVKFIGFSYRMAEDPNYNWFLSFLGFTCGVGLCEEVCKALPVLWRSRQGKLMTWRDAAVWGLASGVGFGVSEGITYASRHYNGIHTGEIYVVRFASCVALHAVWSASAALTLYRRQGLLEAAENGWEWFARLLVIVGIPMVLHGLYDTLLKKDMGAAALATAAVSFAWLAFQIETSRKREQAAEAGVAGASA